MFDVNITGEEELIAALKNLPQKVSREAAFESVVIACQPVIDAAKAYAPVETGSLQRSIGSVVRRYRRGALTKAIVGARRGFGTADNEPANYAHLVEYGHATHRGTRDQRAFIGPVGVPPHPFMRPAWDATSEQALEILKTEFAARIEQAAENRK